MKQKRLQKEQKRPEKEQNDRRRIRNDRRKSNNDRRAKTTRERAKTTGERATTTGERAKTTGERAKTTGERAKTTGDDDFVTPVNPCLIYNGSTGAFIYRTDKSEGLIWNYNNETSRKNSLTNSPHGGTDGSGTDASTVDGNNEISGTITIGADNEINNLGTDANAHSETNSPDTKHVLRNPPGIIWKSHQFVFN